MLGALVKVPVVADGAVAVPGRLAAQPGRRHRGLLLALLLAAIVYRPFWAGLDTLTALRRTDLFTASLGSVLRLALAPALGLADRGDWSRSSRWAASRWSCWRRCVRAWPSARDVVRLAYVTLLGGLPAGDHLVSGVVPGLAVGARRRAAARRRHLEVALLSLGGLLQYFVFIYLWVIGVFPPEESLALQFSAFVGIVGPAVLAVVVWRYALRDTLAEETVRAD